MILPTKTIKPIDSLFCISSYIIEEALDHSSTFDEIYEKIKKSYPKEISIETMLLCLDYLFIVGKLEIKDEVIKIKL